MSIKDMVKGKKVTFLFYKEDELWYVTECGFEFPVPINDTQGAVFNNEDKAIFFMRWIKKHIDVVEQIEIERRAHSASEDKRIQKDIDADERHYNN